MPEVIKTPDPQSPVVKKVGVIGGGQLAWMMADAAKKLGIELVVQTPEPTDPAVAIAAHTVVAPIDDPVATDYLAQQADVITFENEFVNLEALTPLAKQGVCFQPSLKTLEPLLDKYYQRCYLKELGLPTPQFIALDHPSQLAQLGFPVVLKVRRHGYDGQGTFILKSQAELEATWQRLGHTPVLLEEFVPFDRELAVIAARSITGEVVVYPVTETQQEDQVCRRVLAPAALDSRVVTEVGAIAHTLLNGLNAVGVFGIELFLTLEGKILVNEISPRTHNSGHFTLDACETSQFEQQLRAVCHIPLGSTALKTIPGVGQCYGAVMINLLGYEDSASNYAAKRQQLAQIPQAHLYWYGKTRSRPGRKLGHVTVLLVDQDARSQTLTPANYERMQHLIETVESIWYE
ncbi:MAG: 5-(carboxyamino)imidazole ribonucleotide synthase [Leptolyngbyaceae bacterium]|nr:5-(carboxyamino)imidazole ribonucleotide synthase [Leptolyngbyaceae bacterium]